MSGQPDQGDQGNCVSGHSHHGTCADCTENNHCGDGKRCGKFHQAQSHKSCIPKIANGQPDEGSHDNCISGQSLWGKCVGCKEPSHCPGGGRGWMCKNYECVDISSYEIVAESWTTTGIENFNSAWGAGDYFYDNVF